MNDSTCEYWIHVFGSLGIAWNGEQIRIVVLADDDPYEIKSVPNVGADVAVDVDALLSNLVNQFPNLKFKK